MVFASQPFRYSARCPGWEEIVNPAVKNAEGRRFVGITVLQQRDEAWQQLSYRQLTYRLNEI